MAIKGNILALPQAQNITPSVFAPSPGCGPCSGVNKYNNQLPEDNNCSFVPASQNNPPAQSNPLPLHLVPPNAPSAFPQLVSQFVPSFFNPPRIAPQSQGSIGYNTSRRCTPVHYSPVTTIPVQKPIYTNTPITNNPTVEPCANLRGGYNWNNQGSMLLPIQSMQASMPNMPIYTTPPAIPERLTPTMPSLVDSGLRRSSVTPNDMCAL